VRGPQVTERPPQDISSKWHKISKYIVYYNMKIWYKYKNIYTKCRYNKYSKYQNIWMQYIMLGFKDNIGVFWVVHTW